MNPPQYSCLENPMDRRAWQASVDRVAKSKMTETTLLHTYCFLYFDVLSLYDP